MRYARRTLSLILGTLLVLTTAAAAATTPPALVIPWEQWAPSLGGSSAVYAAGRFVAVGGRAVSTSTDGMSWQQVHTEPNFLGPALPGEPGAVPGYASVNLNAVTYGQGRFVAVGNPWFRVVTSTDGITWTGSEQWTGSREQGPYRELKDVTFGGGRFVAVGQSAGGSETIASTDGLQWSHSAKFPDARLNSIAYDGHRFLAVGAKSLTGPGGVWTSPDGIAWTPIDVDLPVLEGVVYSEGRFVAVATTLSDGSYSFTSTDGSHWTQARLPGYVAGRLSTSGGYYFQPVADKVLGVSRDGLNWIQTTAPHFTKTVVMGGGRFVAVGSGISVLSPCGGLIDLSSKDSACKSVTTVQAAGAITGYPDGTFRADAPVSRAEFAKMLTIAVGQSPQPGGPLDFSDTQGHWAAVQGYLQAAVATDAITGYPDRTFRPDGQITRAELIKMAVGALGLEQPYLAAYYSDVDDADWFSRPVNTAALGRLIGPNAVATLWPGPTLQPRQAASRGETAALLANLLAIKDSVPSLSVSPWTIGQVASDCDETRLLRAGVQGRAGNGERRFSLFLHNNTNRCGEPGAIQKPTGNLDVAIYPLGRESGSPALTVPIADLPPQLAPGERASRVVDLARALAPGWYTAKIIGAVMVDGQSYAYSSDARASDKLMVSIGNIMSGGTTQAANQAPSVGGVAMPLARAEWDAGGTIIHVQVPSGCNGDRDRAVALTNPRAIAQGPGFETQLPEVGFNGDDTLTSWGFAAAPGESRTLVLRADATVSQCQGTTMGGPLASGPVEWVVPLR